MPQTPYPRSRRDALILRHRGLAVGIARRYMDGRVPDEDLVQEAMIGLIHAVDRFNPAMGHAFSSFATRCIYGCLMRLFRDRAFLVRYPRSVAKMIKAVGRAVAELGALGLPTTDEAVAARLRVPERLVRRARLAYTASQHVGWGDLAFEPVITRDDDTEPFDYVSDEASEIAEAIGYLTPEQRELVIALYFEHRSQADVAKQFGVSQMTISRRLMRIHAHLRELLTENRELTKTRDLRIAAQRP